MKKKYENVEEYKSQYRWLKNNILRTETLLVKKKEQIQELENKIKNLEG